MIYDIPLDPRLMAPGDISVPALVPRPSDTMESTGEVKPVDYEVKPVDYEVKPVEAVKVPVPDYSQVVDPNKIFDLWKSYQNNDLNLLGAMNGVQSHFDDTTFWDRNNKNGYQIFQINDTQACMIARQNSINGTPATNNNKEYAGLDDFYAEQQKAFDKLYAYNSTKFSKETIHGTYRQKAAKKGAASRKANNVKRLEEMVVGIVEELVALRDYRGVLDDKYKQRFDRLAKEIMAVTKVRQTPEITANLAYGTTHGVQG